MAYDKWSEIWHSVLLGTHTRRVLAECQVGGADELWRLSCNPQPKAPLFIKGSAGDAGTDVNNSQGIPVASPE